MLISDIKHSHSHHFFSPGGAPIYWPQHLSPTSLGLNLPLNLIKTQCLNITIIPLHTSQFPVLLSCHQIYSFLIQSKLPPTPSCLWTVEGGWKKIHLCWYILLQFLTINLRWALTVARKFYRLWLVPFLSYPPRQLFLNFLLSSNLQHFILYPYSYL